MASTFSFGFSGDDIDIDIDNDVEGSDHGVARIEQNKPSNNNKLFPAKRHILSEWASQITIFLQKEKTTIARRELFDVRTQLMAEDDDDDSELIAGLEQGDLKPNFYEGGFKTWECALDLADVLLLPSEKGGELSLSKDGDGLHVVELGCGTAVPSLAVFARLLSLPLPNPETEKKQRFRFTLADYNSTLQKEEEEEGELDIEPALLDAFQTDLSNRGITLDFISGGWSAEFVQLVLDPNLSSTASTATLILASETIYAPSSLGVFSKTLIELLRHSGQRHTATALIAAKKVYFGVGGGVDEFLQVLYKQPLREGEGSIEVQERKEINSGGVKRVVLEVRIR
ncbi:hypothetical protein UA08_07803 [Talaromyces atroroseus]|uniref:protein-histidine N-methyltransferase n=1 Tax=Talaromyces atroroseus TaxID=1441469 RepID=A0A225AR88_TALAT|nr:hypothetical protein UA08_07803 [Talaromyces atroroseus]OKL56965.1 hypothetical protein UA08_07803 [Talaromyces atroroseus]